jgi:hypothetical protein
MGETKGTIDHKLLLLFLDNSFLMSNEKKPNIQRVLALKRSGFCWAESDLCIASPHVDAFLLCL